MNEAPLGMRVRWWQHSLLAEHDHVEEKGRRQISRAKHLVNGDGNVEGVSARRWVAWREGVHSCTGGEVAGENKKEKTAGKQDGKVKNSGKRRLKHSTHARFAKTEQAKKSATVSACHANGSSLLNLRRSWEGKDTAATSANCVMVMNAGEYSHP